MCRRLGSFSRADVRVLTDSQPFYLREWKEDAECSWAHRSWWLHKSRSHTASDTLQLYCISLTHATDTSLILQTTSSRWENPFVTFGLWRLAEMLPEKLMTCMSHQDCHRTPDYISETESDVPLSNALSKRYTRSSMINPYPFFFSALTADGSRSSCASVHRRSC